MKSCINTFPLLLFICFLPFTVGSQKLSVSHIKANTGLSNPVDIEIQDFSLISMLPSPESRSLSDCQISISNCELCTFEKCIKCKQAFTLVNNTCSFNRPSNKNTPGGITLAVIVVSVFVFLSLFCFICIYFARKNRHKYAESPNIQGNNTKHNSIVSETYDITPTSSVTMIINEGFDQVARNVFDQYRGNDQIDNCIPSDVCFFCFGDIVIDDRRYLENGNTAHKECSKSK